MHCDKVDSRRSSSPIEMMIHVKMLVFVTLISNIHFRPIWSPICLILISTLVNITLYYAMGSTAIKIGGLLVTQELIRNSQRNINIFNGSFWHAGFPNPRRPIARILIVDIFFLGPKFKFWPLNGPPDKKIGLHYTSWII